MRPAPFFPREAHSTPAGLNASPAKLIAPVVGKTASTAPVLLSTLSSEPPGYVPPFQPLAYSVPSLENASASLPPTQFDVPVPPAGLKPVPTRDPTSVPAPVDGLIVISFASEQALPVTP